MTINTEQVNVQLKMEEEQRSLNMKMEMMIDLNAKMHAIQCIIAILSNGTLIVIKCIRAVKLGHPMNREQINANAC